MSQLLERIQRDIRDDHYYQQNFSNEGQRFLAWYLRNIYLRTLKADSPRGVWQIPEAGRRHLDQQK